MSINSQHWTEATTDIERITLRLKSMIIERQFHIDDWQGKIEEIKNKLKALDKSKLTKREQMLVVLLPSSLKLCEDQLKDALKKPTTLSLVGAFLSCSPSERTPDEFIDFIASISNGNALTATVPSDLNQLKDSWFQHCVDPKNETLISLPKSIIDHAFIGVLLKTPKYQKIRISLPSAPQTTPAPLASLSYDG